MAQNWAIVVGINQYRFLQPLKYAKRDAETMQAFLAQSGFQRIFLFTDDSPEIGGRTTEPFRNNLLRVLRQVFEQPFMQDGDNFWFFFSGHGIRHREQDYLMPLDGDPEDVEHTGISTHLIANYLRSCGADNAVMILDACRSEGKKSGEGIGRQTEAEARQTGVISIFSCSPQQYSYEIDAIEQGAFTHALLEGLGIRGRCATVERLNQYLANRVPELVQQHLGRARQVPYTIAEPIDRAHLILMPQHVSLADIATLKNDAYRAQMEQDWERAERLWIRVLAAASGQDSDAIRALQTIAIRRNAGTIPEPAQVPDPPESPLPEPKKDSEKGYLPDSDLLDSDSIIIVSPSAEPKSNLITELEVTSEASEPFSETDLSPELISDSLPDDEEQPSLNRRQFIQGAGILGVVLAIGAVNQIVQGFSSPTTPDKTPEKPQLKLSKFAFRSVTVDEHGQVMRLSNKSADFFEEDLGNGVILEMVKIPSGSFKMGSPNTEGGRSSTESPQHRVTVPSFFIGKFAITQAQYQQIMGSNPARYKGENRPVEQVSWDDAVELCAKLSKQTGRTYRLPSEAEWEYACRAGTTTPFHLGETITDALVNYNAHFVYQLEPKGEYRQQTTEVGMFLPNAFGLYDMHGNVLEWCQDYWHDSYQGAPNNGNAWMPDDQKLPRLLRGGCWNLDPRLCRSATRYKEVVEWRDSNVGFRVVCSSA